MSDQLVAESSNWPRTTLTTDKPPCLWWDSNSQPQKASGPRPTLWPRGHWDRLSLWFTDQKCLRIYCLSLITTFAPHFTLSLLHFCNYIRQRIFAYELWGLSLCHLPHRPLLLPLSCVQIFSSVFFVIFHPLICSVCVGPLMCEIKFHIHTIKKGKFTTFYFNFTF
jgi:hypothetical protein